MIGDDWQVKTKDTRANGAGSEQRPEDDVATLLEAAGPRRDDAAVRERVKANVRARWQMSVRARAIRRRWFLVAHLSAAALALAVTVSLWPFPPARDPGNRSPKPAPVVALLETASGPGPSLAGAVGDRRLAVGDPVIAGATILTGAVDLAALRTPHGVSVRVGGATRLRLISSTELVLEEGRVYIDNPPGRTTGRRVVVRTPLGVVRDVGTQFEAALDGNALRLRVREGAVSLERAVGVETTAAGSEIRVSANGSVERRTFPTHGAEWAWATRLAPPIEIDGRPLGEFLSGLTREMGWRLAFQDEALAASSPGIVMHGSVAGLTPDEALSTVLATCGLDSRLTGETLVIEETRRKR